MIIISNKPGQLANQLIVYSSFVAFCIEHRIELRNPAFHQYADYFNFFSKKYKSKWLYDVVNILSRFLSKTKLGNRLINVIDIKYDSKFDLDNESNLLQFNNCITLVSGWQFRGPKLLLKHKSEILKIFYPKNIYLNNVIDFFYKNSLNQKIVVGIHIRRGDYEKFEGGKYFYDFEIYKLIMNNLTELFRDVNLVFLICSNEKNYEKFFLNFEYPFIFGPNHELEDLYSFARCNYLIGPPSTYTMWASFYGNVPLYMIKDPCKKIYLDDFKIQETF